MKNGHFNISLNKQSILCLFSIVLVVLIIGSTLAVTANIGNARMILRAQVGDTIQKTILVKNINNESVNIEITASGDLEKDIKILDNNFTLKPGEQKDARFTIKVTKNGAFENKIIVKFFSPTEGKGVALSSNVVVMVNGNQTIDENSTNPGTNPFTDNPIIGENKNPMMILLTLTGIILLIFFVVLIVYYFKNNKKKQDNKIEDIASEEKTEDIEENKKTEVKTKPKKRAKKK